MKFVFPLAVLGYLLTTLPACGQAATSRNLLKEAQIRVRVREVVTKAAAPRPPFIGPLLPTKAVAVAVAEPILFARYGKENIIRQRPYEVLLVEGVWYLCGTLPPGWDGGVFEIMLNANDARVLLSTHGK
jgi:hypothetical protein